MDLQFIREQLYRRYIEPTKKKRRKYIGVEFEMPIVNLSDQAVDFRVVHSITDSFLKHFGFTVSETDDDGNVYCAASPEKGDILSYDCSYNNLELSFGKEENLFDGEKYSKTEFTPRTEDIEYLRTFKFIDLTFRGTIEFRSICCQPIKDSLCVAAFHLGLIRRVEELAQIFEHDRILYHHGYTAGELRKMLVRRELPDFIDKDGLYALARQIVDLAYDGLAQRGLNEEKLLEPLYQRIEARTSPARKILDMKNSGVDLHDIILEYAQI